MFTEAELDSIFTTPAAAMKAWGINTTNHGWYIHTIAKLKVVRVGGRPMVYTADVAKHAAELAAKRAAKQAVTP